MSVKKIILINKYDATIYKKRGLKSLRLTVSPINGVRLSMPYWVSYKYGEAFLNHRIDFIEKHYTKATIISDNQIIGKQHKINFINKLGSNNITSRVLSNRIIIYLPIFHTIKDDIVQNYTKQIAIKVLRKEANEYLPKRLKELSLSLNFSFNSVKIRQLKSRWGSCDTNKNITLNLFLMSLPDNLIDYVLIHELSHTQILKHDKNFWLLMSKILPNVKSLKNEIKLFQPTFG